MSDSTIITAVSAPNVAKIGVGASAITKNPRTDVRADSTSAPPVPVPDRRTASSAVPVAPNSSRKRAVKCVEKSIPTPTAIAAIVAVTTLTV